MNSPNRRPTEIVVSAQMPDGELSSDHVASDRLTEIAQTRRRKLVAMGFYATAAAVNEQLPFPEDKPAEEPILAP